MRAGQWKAAEYSSHAIQIMLLEADTEGLCKKVVSAKPVHGGR
jgi:hypothetical protein